MLRCLRDKCLYAAKEGRLLILDIDSKISFQQMLTLKGGNTHTIEVLMLVGSSGGNWRARITTLTDLFEE